MTLEASSNQTNSVFLCVIKFKPFCWTFTLSAGSHRPSCGTKVTRADRKHTGRLVVSTCQRPHHPTGLPHAGDPQCRSQCWHQQCAVEGPWQRVPAHTPPPLPLGEPEPLIQLVLRVWGHSSTSDPFWVKFDLAFHFTGSATSLSKLHFAGAHQKC